MSPRTLAWAIALFGLLGALFAEPQEESTEERLRQVQEQIAAIQQKLEQLKNEKSSILGDISQIELQQEMTRIEYNKLDLEAGVVLHKIEVKNREKLQLENKIAASRDSLKRVLRVLYKSGEMGYIKFFVSVKSFDQLFRNYYLITLLINTKVAKIADIRTAVDKLQKVRNELNAQAAAYDRLKAGKNAKIRELHGYKDNKMTLINRINTERSFHQGMLDELKREAENLNQLMSQSVSSSAPPAGSVTPQKGKIPWPIPGHVISTFGRIKSDQFDTYTINNGIEIKPSKDDNIRAVLDGEIVYADYFSGYGNLIIIQHRRNFHTLYGHCESLLKKKGDTVVKGDEIATVGSTGATGRTTLYFEVRESLKAVNPLSWLEKR